MLKAVALYMTKITFLVVWINNLTGLKYSTENKCNLFYFPFKNVKIEFFTLINPANFTKILLAHLNNLVGWKSLFPGCHKKKNLATSGGGALWGEFRLGRINFRSRPRSDPYARSMIRFLINILDGIGFWLILCNFYFLRWYTV